MNAEMLYLSDFQKIFYNEWAKNPARFDYNLVMDSTLSGFFSVDSLNQALIRFVNDHLIIHSNVHNAEGQLVWVERDLLSPSSRLVFYYDKPLSQKELQELVKLPFDLENDLLIRFYLVKIEKNKYRFINVVHHIIMDGGGASDLYKLYSDYYNDPNYKSCLSLDEQRCLFKDFLHKIKKEKERVFDASCIYWKNHLAKATPLDISFISHNRLNESNNFINPFGEIRFDFRDTDYSKIKYFSKKYTITPYLFGQVVFAGLIYSITEQDCISISYPIAINAGKSIYFGANVNTIISNYEFDKNMTFSDVIAFVKKDLQHLKSSKSKYFSLLAASELAPLSQGSLDVSFIQTF